MDATGIIIYFIGLCLFTGNIKEDPGLHVLLPRVGSAVIQPGNPNPNWDAQVRSGHHGFEPSGRTATQTPVAPTIDDHVALLLFPTAIYDESRSSWKASEAARFSRLESLKGYSYVQLNGEQLTFVTDSARNGTIGMPPRNLPRVTASQAEGLKHSLLPGFRPPYADAAAVVNLHEGQSRVCQLPEESDIAAGRVDTTVRLETTSMVTVVGVVQKYGHMKTLVLNVKAGSTPTIYVANVPLSWAASRQAGVHQAHYLEYYKMIGKDPRTNSGRPRSSQAVPVCDMEPAFAPAGPGARISDRYAPALAGQHTVLKTIVADPECSNTQWP